MNKDHQRLIDFLLRHGPIECQKQKWQLIALKERGPANFTSCEYRENKDGLWLSSGSNPFVTVAIAEKWLREQILAHKNFLSMEKSYKKRNPQRDNIIIRYKGKENRIITRMVDGTELERLIAAYEEIEEKP